MMSGAKKRAPKRRFKEFLNAGDWEQRKLGDFYTFKNGLNKEKVYFGYGDSIINFTDVFHNRQIYSSTLKGKVFVNKKELENFKVKEGDLFFTRTSETIDEIGFPAVVMEPMERVVFSGFVLRGRAEKNDPLVNIFKSYIFFTDNFRSEMKKKSSMTTRALTSGTALKEMYFSYPKDLEEQTKIGEILLRLDNVITLHQRKLDKLQATKKALLQEMFPEEGQDKPKRRFKGFTDAWEQRKLSDLMEVTSVKRIHQADWTDSGVRFFRARDIVSSMNNEEIDNPVFISKDKYEEYSRVSGKVIEGDLLVTGVGTIGVPYLIKDTTPLYFKDGNIIWFKNNNTLNGSYFYYCFQNSYIQNQIYSASGKGTVGTYTIENGKKTSIRYPSLKEQIKIGNLLDTMTTMITLHQHKLDKLKNLKQAYLNEMFV